MLFQTYFNSLNMTFDFVKMIKLLHFIYYFHYMKASQMISNYCVEIQHAYRVCFGGDDKDETRKIQTKISDFFKLKNEKDK